MIPRPVAITSVLMLGLWNVLAAPTVLAQEPTDRQEAPRRTTERSVVEGLSTSGDTTVLSEVVDETVRRDAETSQRTRREFVTDANGRRRLVSTIEERHVVRPDGGHQIIRDFTEPDLNGRSRTTRREHEEMVAEGDGSFITQIEVTEPSINGGRFVPTERIEQRERQVADQLVELESTTYSNPTGRGRWEVSEQRVLTRDFADGSAEAVELIYRPDPSGNLVQSERIVSKEWSASRGREFRTEEIYGQDINNGGALSRRPVTQVEIVRTVRSDGRVETTRTVSERRGTRMQVVERVVERSRPDGRGGTVIEQEIQREEVYGRLRN